MANDCPSEITNFAKLGSKLLTCMLTAAGRPTNKGIGFRV